MASTVALGIVIASLSGIALTYIIYPIWAIIFSGRKRKIADFTHKLPKVSVLFAAYNEEKVITEKLESILASNYPKDLIEVIVGSDMSSDRTDEIIADFNARFGNIHLFRTQQRSGKSAIMNELAKMATGEILIATDANIIFTQDTVSELIKPFCENKIGAVAGTLTYAKGGQNTTSTSEASYLNLENKIRQAESNHFGYCLGMEGGLYAIRKNLWSSIPLNTFMEDFYQTMTLLKNGWQIYYSSEAKGIEDISTSIEEEYRRKIRISIGNYQNLVRFGSLIFLRPFPLGTTFLLHKVLRWTTPLLALIAVVAGMWTPYWLYLTTVLLLVPISQILWIKVFPPNALAYFCTMNLGLLVGFFKYLGGINSSVWQPTKRKQYES